jgi:hypothetical protein
MIRIVRLIRLTINAFALTTKKAATALRGHRYHQNTLHCVKGKLIFYFFKIIA